MIQFLRKLFDFKKAHKEEIIISSYPSRTLSSRSPNRNYTPLSSIDPFSSSIFMSNDDYSLPSSSNYSSSHSDYSHG